MLAANSSIVQKLQILAQLRVNCTLCASTFTVLDTTSYINSLLLYWRQQNAYTASDACSSFLYTTISIIHQEKNYQQLIVAIYRAMIGVWRLSKTYEQDEEFVKKHEQVMEDLAFKVVREQEKYDPGLIAQVKSEYEDVLECTPRQIFERVSKIYESEDPSQELMIHPIFGHMSRYQIETMMRKYGRHILYLSLSPFIGPVPSYLLSQALKRN